MIYLPLQVIRFHKSILLIIHYKYLKSCSKDFILKNLILRTRSCGTAFIKQHSWLVHFRQAEVRLAEMICTTVHIPVFIWKSRRSLSLGTKSSMLAQGRSVVCCGTGEGKVCGVGGNRCGSGWEERVLRAWEGKDPGTASGGKRPESFK